MLVKLQLRKSWIVLIVFLPSLKAFFTNAFYMRVRIDWEAHVQTYSLFDVLMMISYKLHSIVFLFICAYILLILVMICHSLFATIAFWNSIATHLFSFITRHWTKWETPRISPLYAYYIYCGRHIVCLLKSFIRQRKLTESTFLYAEYYERRYCGAWKIRFHDSTYV